MSKLFESKTWENTKKALCEGKDLERNADGSLNANKKKMMETVLENTRKEMLKLMESATIGATSAANIASLNKVILPVIRRVMPTVIANEIIGVQPMTGPVAQIHTLRVRYADTFPANGTGAIAGDEAFSPANIARYYSGNGNINTPKGADTTSLEGVMGNRISVQTLKQIVEVKTRKLSARWTFEAAQDAQAQQGLDIEAEIMGILANEITAEIDQEVLTSLRALPGSPTMTFDQSAVTGTPTFIGDVHAALATMVNRQANLIAARTRRGAGNWMVVSPTALTILQGGTTSAFARTTEGTFDAPTNTKFVGTLNNSVKVYVDAYANDSTPVLVGYKGSELDAAAFYCPYVPLTSSGAILDPNTGEAVVSFMSRYGYVELSNTASSLGNAADYLGLIGIDATKLTFM